MSFSSSRISSTLIGRRLQPDFKDVIVRSEEHTSELQSLTNLVCRLLLEKKKRFHLGHRLGSFQQDDDGVSEDFLHRNGWHIRSTRGRVLFGGEGVKPYVCRAAIRDQCPC